MVTVTAVSNHAYSPDDLIPLKEAARLLGVAPDTVRVWERKGKVSAIRTLGGHRRFRRGDIEALREQAGAA